MFRNTLVASLLAFLLFTFPTHANVKVLSDDNSFITLEVESIYLLGDSDTKIDARNVAIQNAKQLAAESVGSHIESETVIENDEVTKNSIKVASSAIMKTEVVSEHMEVLQNGQMKLILVTKVNVDKTSLNGKLKSLATDKKKRNQLLSLQKENTKLLNQIKSLNSKLAAQKKSTTVDPNKSTQKNTKLVEERDKLLSKLERNSNQIRKTFEKGSLFSLAKKSGDEYNAAKAAIDSEVFSYIQRNTQIEVSDPEFKDNGNGLYDLEIRVGWKMDKAKLESELNKYFWGHKKRNVRNQETRGKFGQQGHNIIELHSFYNEKDVKKVAYADKLFKEMSSRQMYLELKAGSYKGELQLTGWQKSWGHSDCDSKSSYCFNTQVTLEQKSLFDQNPVVIRNVPQEVLETLTAIDAEIVIR